MNISVLPDAEPTCVLIVLAGGKAQRMGRLGRISPKPMLVAYDLSILERQLLHAGEAGIRQVVISTRPELAGPFEEVVTRFRAVCPVAPEIRVLRNPGHAAGPLEGLARALGGLQADRCLMSLGDMFFLANPFPSLLAAIREDEVGLGVHEPWDPRELEAGGWVICAGREIRGVEERPGPAPEGALRWTGLALFPTRRLDDLRRFLATAPPGRPEGELFEDLRSRGTALVAARCPEALNVNSPDDLLIATLLAARETHAARPRVRDALGEAAGLVRRALLGASPVPAAAEAG